MTGENYDPKALADELQQAVGDIVRKQAELGVDVISDGELSKTSFQYYVTDRLSGLERFTPKPGVRSTRENRAFPTFYKDGSHSGTQSTRYACTGPLKYVGHKQVEADIANLKAGLKGASPVDVFMPSVSPSSCVGLMENRHYRDDEEHLYAVAEALREEYQAIVAAGFIVQIDDPRLAMNYMLNPGAHGGAAARLGGAADRGAQPRAPRHSRRAGAAPHLLRHQHGAAHQRLRAQAPRRSHRHDQRRLLLVRDGEPAP